MAFNRTHITTVVPTVTAGAYSIGDVIGGLITFTVGGPNDGGNISRVLLYDGANQKSALKAYFFHKSPTGDFADNAPFAPTVVDWGNFCGTIDIDVADYLTVGSVAFAEVKHQALPYKVPNGNLYLYLVAIDAPTYSATDDVHITISGWKD